MSQCFAKINSNLFDSMNISTNIATINKINCKIEDMPLIKGAIATEQVITVKLQMPSTISPDIYNGQYEIEPNAHSAIILDTNGKKLLNDIIIKKIPYFETSNLSGYTVYIASEVD